MKSLRERIALVNVAAESLRLVPKNETVHLVDLSKVSDWIDTQQRARRTVFFARVCLPRSALRIERRVLTEITFDGY
jgi:hypothetical protein